MFLDGQKRTYSMTKHHYHAVIWIDHSEARVFHISPTDVETLVLHPDDPTRHIHHKANSIGSGHAKTSPEYLRELLNRLQMPAQLVAHARKYLAATDRMQP
jgi:hypothetical protein